MSSTDYFQQVFNDDYGYPAMYNANWIPGQALGSLPPLARAMMPQQHDEHNLFASSLHYDKPKEELWNSSYNSSYSGGYANYANYAHNAASYHAGAYQNAMGYGPQNTQRYLPIEDVIKKPSRPTTPPKCTCKPSVNRIPRPRNAFILFRQKYHQSVLDESVVSKSNPEVSRELGRRWRNLAPEERDHWNRLAEEEKRNHRERYPNYRYLPRRNGKKNCIACQQKKQQQLKKQESSPAATPSLATPNTLATPLTATPATATPVNAVHFSQPGNAAVQRSQSEESQLLFMHHDSVSHQMSQMSSPQQPENACMFSRYMGSEMAQYDYDVKQEPETPQVKPEQNTFAGKVDFGYENVYDRAQYGYDGVAMNSLQQYSASLAREVKKRSAEKY